MLHFLHQIEQEVSGVVVTVQVLIRTSTCKIVEIASKEQSKILVICLQQLLVLQKVSTETQPEV